MVVTAQNNMYTMFFGTGTIISASTAYMTNCQTSFLVSFNMSWLVKFLEWLVARWATNIKSLVAHLICLVIRTR